MFKALLNFWKEVQAKEAELKGPLVVVEEPKVQTKDFLTVEEFEDFFEFYAGEEHQRKAIAQLHALLTGTELSEDAEWVVTYRNAETTEPVAPTDKHVLAVPYYSQRDNYRDASRTCFSSSVAMALKKFKPEAINSDDDYIQEVFKVGDTIQSWVHVQVLGDAYDVDAEFTQAANLQTIKDQVDKGIPVPCGILHQGPAMAPTGGGHWITVIGYKDDENYSGGGYFIVHDPWGEIDHASGTYVSQDGSGLKYSYSLMNSRWTVSGKSDGWAIILHGEVNKEAPRSQPKLLVNTSQLAYIWNCEESLIKDWEIKELNECLRSYDITTPARIRHFLSQTAHESGGGRYMKEISNGEYLEGRTDIGNTEPGDGPRFKGAGYLQMTGRANYRVLADWTGDERVMEGVDYVAATYPFTSAGVWWTKNRMNDLIDSGADVESVTRRVNGGYNGLADRKYYYNRCQSVI